MKRLLVLLVAAAVLCTPAAAGETFPGENGPLAYTVLRRGCAHLVTIQPDGTDRSRITTDGDCDWAYPVFSPDGERLLAVLEGSGIFVMQPDGSERNRIVRFPGFLTRPPVWSPDGTKIAYERIMQNQEQNAIYVASADGSSVIEIARRWVSDVYSEDLFWSPDSSDVLFVKDRRNHGADLRIAAADGSGTRRITDNRRYERTPDWSPDGRHVVFAASGDIFRMRVDGAGTARRLTATQPAETNPVYSPDGTSIAFVWARDPIRTRVALMAPDGSGRRRLSGKAMNAFMPVWSPDGTEIAFQVFEDELVGTGHETNPAQAPPDGVYVVDVASRDRRRLFEGYLLYDDLDWGPAPPSLIP